jgi:hypothetical protein
MPSSKLGIPPPKGEGGPVRTGMMGNTVDWDDW